MARELKTNQINLLTETAHSWLRIRRKRDGNVMRPHELENCLEFPNLTNNEEDPNILERIKGSLFGLAIGDAAGAHAEFRPKEFMKNNLFHTMEGGGTWGLEKGQFTDDTSMALCLANSLIVKKDFVPYDQLVRYKWWFREGYMSSTGKCFDIGKATRESLEEFERRQQRFAQEHGVPLNDMDSLSDCDLMEKFDVDCSKDGVAGNGSLMRLAPVPLFFYKHPTTAVEFSKISSQITHGDQLACDACRYYSALIVAAVNGESKEQLLSNDFYTQHAEWFGGKDLHPDIMAIAQGSYKKTGEAEKDIRGAGFVVLALEAALWAFYSDENSFRTGVSKAVNLGDDTDTTAAIYGQLAGACYGFRKLDERWRDRIYAKKFILCISEWLFYEGQRWKPKSWLRLLTINSDALKELFRSMDPSSIQAKGDYCAGISTTTSRAQDTYAKRATKSQSGERHAKPCKVDIRATDNSNTMSRPTLNPTQFQRRHSSNESTQVARLYPTLSKLTDQTLPDQGFGSAEQINYFLNDFHALQNIDTWLQGLGNDFEQYGRIFRERNVDRFWLLNFVNQETLQHYGITNRNHQELLLSRINALKRLELNVDQIWPPTN